MSDSRKKLPPCHLKRGGVLQVEKEPRTPSELEHLLSEFNASPYVLGLSNTEVEQLKSRWKLLCFYFKDQLSGFVAIIPLSGRWVEFGPICVASNARGKGIGHTIMSYALEYWKKEGYSFYAVTCHPAVKKFLQESGFVSKSVFSLPRVVLISILLKISWKRIVGSVFFPYRSLTDHFLLELDG
jgi:GNAT superfamily N-acetyltransferase